MLLLALSLAAGLAPGDTAARPAGPLPAAVAGMVTVHRQPAIPIVALRLSLLADDPPGYAGAGHLFQHRVVPSLREQVRRVGGEVQEVRGSDAVVYTVVGPASELGFLAEVLRSALRVPAFSEGEVARASRALEDERNAEWETAAAHVRARLRASLLPADLPAAGTAAAAGRLTPDALAAVWGEMYRPERVSVVAVGDVEVGQVREAFARLPDAAEPGLGETAPDTMPAAPPVAPEATRGWLGLGYSASDADPVALTVTARLLRQTLRERLPASAQVEAEHWWTRQGQALVAVVASQPAGLAAARRAVRASLTALRDDLDADRVRGAAAGVRRDMLFYARKPEHMAEVVGGFIDREGSPDAAQRFYAAVEAVDEEAVRRVLDALAERTPTLVDVPPQKIPERNRR
ncbi:MAG TPA: hypothetical protein VF263_11565 [Longimicrobiaceae bacterium]